MLISIVIPHRNTPEKLERLLNSIPSNIETIVVDDGSQGDKIKYLKLLERKFKMNTCFIWNKAVNAGVARNNGVQRAKGRWIIFADADDEFITTTLEKLKEFLEKSGSDVVYFYSKAIKEGTHELSLRTHAYNKMLDEFPKNKNNICFEWVVPWGRAIRADFIKTKNLQFASRIASNDIEFSTDLALSRPSLGSFKKEVYICYESNNSLTATRTREKCEARFLASASRNFKLLCHFSLRKFSYNVQYYLGLRPFSSLVRFVYYTPIFIINFLIALIVNSFFYLSSIEKSDR